MKKLLLSAVVLSAVGLNAQSEPAVKTEKAVGIETTAPRATLDVNGDARLRKVDLMSTPISTTEIFPDCPCVLTIDKFGVIHRIPKDQFVLAGGSTSGGSQGGGNQGGGNDNQSTGGANLGNTVNAVIEDQDDYVVSLIYNGHELQGKIDNDAHKVSIKIPYTNGNGQSYSSAESKTTTTTASAEDGNSSPITMTIKEGTLTSSSGNIEAEITTPQLYNVKKLAPGEEEKIAEFKYTVNNQTKTVVLKATGGIPDRLFGTETNGELEHQFIYIPITIKSGNYNKTWLNNNLGADYARVTAPVNGKFDPTRQATKVDDKHAFGSLFQWQRRADGHELINWHSETPKYRSSTQRSGQWRNAGTNGFIMTYSDPGIWVTDSRSQDGQTNLWTNEVSDTNNPCPVGYHVATRSEFSDLITAFNAKKWNSYDWFSKTALVIPKSYSRNALGDLSDLITSVLWLGSSSNVGRGDRLQAGTSGVENPIATYIVSEDILASAYPVRCVKD